MKEWRKFFVTGDVPSLFEGFSNGKMAFLSGHVCGGAGGCPLDMLSGDSNSPLVKKHAAEIRYCSKEWSSLNDSHIMEDELRGFSRSNSRAMTKVSEQKTKRERMAPR